MTNSIAPQKIGIIDMHFDLLMDLYEKRHIDDRNILETEYWPEMQAGDMGVIGAAIYLDSKYLPEMALRVALGQVSRLHTEVRGSQHFAICRSYADILAARQAGKIAFLITMEGVEALGIDPDLLPMFYELGLRSVGLTHARRNMAGDGGLFAPSGSSPQGLTAFGKTVVKQCEALGIIVDLSHLNPAGFNDVLNMVTKPVIFSHTNPRHFYDVERNSTDDQLRRVAQTGGVIGVNAVLVSQKAEETTLDRYIDNIEYVADLCGLDSVAIGFDFFEFIYRQMPEAEKEAMSRYLPRPHFIPDLFNHSHAGNVLRRLQERGFSPADIEKIAWGNWMRVFEQILI